MTVIERTGKQGLAGRVRRHGSITALVLVIVTGVCWPNDVDAAATEVLALNNRGIEFYEQRLYHQAIESFQKGLTLDADDAEVRANLALAWVGLGLEFLNSGESSAAEKAFRQALEVDNEYYAHFGLGYIHFLENEDDDARRCLQRALELDPNFAKAHKILALLSYRDGNEAEAGRLMSRAVELDGEDAEASKVLKRWRQEERETHNFKKRTVRRFELRYDPSIPIATLRMVRDVLNNALDSIGDALGVWPRRRLVVTLFREKSFRSAMGVEHWIGGLFDGQIKIPIRMRESDDAVDVDSSPSKPVVISAEGELRRALAHELTHALVKELYPACPNWLNEGVAQYFEIFPSCDANAATRREVEQRRDQRSAALLAQLRQGTEHRVRLSKIPARLWEHADESRARWSYLQGLGFVEYLVKRHHLFRLRVFLQTARELGSIQTACQLTYGVDLEELEDAWWRTVTSVENPPSD